MKKYSNDKIWKCIFYISVIIGLILIFLIMNKTVYMGEDFALRTSDIYRSSSIGEIISKIFSQMKYWNVRVGEQIAIVFSSIDKSFFNIFNTVIIGFYFYSYYVMVEGKLKIDNYKKAFYIVWSSVLLTFLFMPVLSEIFFWIAGSSNYLWSMCIVLMFLIPYRLLLKNFVLKNSIILLVYNIVIGFLSGMSNENVSITILITVIAMLIYYKLVCKKTIPNWAKVGVISEFSGMMVLLFAPSTRHRIKIYNEIFNVKPGISTYISRIENIIKQFFYNKWIIYLLIFSIIIIIIYLVINKKKNHIDNKNNSDIIITIMFLLSLISVGSLILSPYIEKRSFLYFYTFWFILIIKMVSDLIKNNNILVFLGILAIVFVFPEYKCIKNEYSLYYDEWTIIDVKLKNAYYSGIDEIYIDAPSEKTTRIFNNRIDYFITNPDYIKKFYKISVKFNE